MDPRAETALYVAAIGGLITAALTWYGSGWRLKAWAVVLGLLVAVALYFVGYAWLFGGTK
jgi:hypothetical protein